MSVLVEVESQGAPAAVGPYSQAIVANGLVFCSGQIPLDPRDGQLVAGDIVAQTHRVMKNLSAVLEAAGSGLARVVHCRIYLVDLSTFDQVNSVYAEYFDRPLPARACVEISALPKNAQVEIEAIATA